MAIIDPVRNFGKVTASAGYAAGITTIVLSSGDGAKLPDPVTEGAFNLVWWDWTLYREPSDDPNKEIVRVTVRTGDTLTIVRAQESTSDVNHNTGGHTYKLINAMTKLVLDAIRTNLTHTAGGILFANTDTYPTIDTTNFFWDNTNKQLLLGVGSYSAPSYSFGAYPQTGFYATPTGIAVSLANSGLADFFKTGANIEFILGNVGSGSANTVDILAGASGQRLRLGLSWYIAKISSAPLVGAEMVGDLYPLTDMTSSAEFGDSTRRFLMAWLAQVSTGVLVDTDYDKIPIYNERHMTDWTAGQTPLYDIHSHNHFILTDVSRTLTYSRWFREIVQEVGGQQSLINRYSELYMSLTQVLASGGSINDDEHFWEKYHRVVDEWDIHITGAHRNRYNGVLNAVTTGIGVPDSVAKVFTYALPDALFSVVLTGNRLGYVVTDIKKVVVGTGWVYIKVVIDDATKTTAGFTAYIEYQAVDGATLAQYGSWASMMSLIAGIRAYYLGVGGAVIAFSNVLSVEWALRRYY